MTLPPEIMKELLATFRVDVDDQLQAISDALLGVEKEADTAMRRDVLHGAMRAAHNIKGAARGIGVADVGTISHSLENLLARLMNGETDFSPEIGDLCFEAVDAIKKALQAYTDEADLPFDLGGLTRRLDTGGGTAPEKAAVPPTREPEAEPPPATEPSRGAEPASEPAPTATSAPAPAQKGGEILRISTDKLDRLESLVEEMHASKIDMDDFIDELRRAQAAAYALAAAADTGIRGQAADLTAELERVYKFMRSRGRTLGTVLSSIRYEMRTLRLVPASGLTRPLARSVRDIARQMDKKVNFSTIGEETEMDRAVMDMLTDPMVHLLRNAIDHGIETPADRVGMGKPEAGTVTVSFRLEGGRVAISVADDGRGIDPDKVAESAVAKKVIGAEDVAAMTRSQKLDLIFHPGFSTKQIITDVSGRGVGMDIVRANIQALNGDIIVDTEPGKGSTFRMTVPLTLATERGLVVRSAGQVFAIPVGNVDRVVDVRRKDLSDVEGSKALLLDGHPVAMRQLDRVLGLDGAGTGSDDRYPVVILTVGWRRVGLIVDAVLGQREMVVRPLSPPLRNVRNVAGGTLIGGRVRMVLNPEGVLQGALDSGLSLDLDQGAGERTAKTILAVDDSLTTRTLIRNVLEGAGYDVTSAIDGEEAWNLLAKRSFDLVVTDVEMPTMDGFALTRTIKQSDNRKDIPVIIVTSLASEGDKEKGIEVGADAYIVKGDFETRILLDVVEQLI